MCFSQGLFLAKRNRAAKINGLIAGKTQGKNMLNPQIIAA